MDGGCDAAEAAGVGHRATKTWIMQNKHHELDYSHMSMIARLPPDAPAQWIVVYQAAKVVEGAGDMTLWGAFSNNALSWTKSKPLPIEKKKVLWSPVLHYDPGTDVRGAHDPHVKGYAPRRARTLLFYTESTTCLRGADNGFRTARWSPGGDIKLVFTYDGITWSTPRTIYHQAQDGHIPKVRAIRMWTRMLPRHAL